MDQYGLQPGKRPLRPGSRNPNSVHHTTAPRRQHKLINWTQFRKTLEDSHQLQDITDVEECTSAVKQAATEATTEIDTDEDITQVDSKLAHMIEARKSLQR